MTDAAVTAFGVCLHLFVWVAPWHVSALTFIRITWSRWSVGWCCALLCMDVGFVVHGVLTGITSDDVRAAVQGGCVAYALWRAWRNRPPGRRHRRRVTDAVRRLAERMAPARVPVPVGAS